MPRADEDNVRGPIGAVRAREAGAGDGEFNIERAPALLLERAMLNLNGSGGGPVLTCHLWMRRRDESVR